jgi:uncharacterized protein (TIGR00725 family)
VQASDLKVKVGVMGSAGGNLKAPVLEKARRFGEEAARRGHILITGACPGLPHEANLGAKSQGGATIGISPALNFEEHVLKYHSPYRDYDALIFTGSGLMGREITNIRTCDLVVFMGGRSGTLGEFSIAYDEGKLIGVLTGTGGISDNLDRILGFIDKDTGARMSFSDDPADLLDQLEEHHRSWIVPAYDAIMRGHAPDGLWER